jgi:hypothetical protein
VRTLLGPVAFAWALLAASAARPQGGEQPPDPSLVAPQVSIVVREHATSADMVEVTPLSKDYPPELLRSQCQALGASLGSPPRGLDVRVESVDPAKGITFVKASFATDGIIDLAERRLNLQAVVRAFLGAPEPHTLSSFLISFAGEAPQGDRTLRDYSSDAVVVKASVNEAPAGIDYRIVALTQDPSKVTIPDHYTPADRPDGRPASGVVTAPDPVVLGLVGVGGLAAGALVYFAFAGRKGRRRPTAPPRD